MKKTMITIFSLVLSVIFALIFFDLLVYLGLYVPWLYAAVQSHSAWILAALLLIWLKILFIGVSGRRCADILQMTIVQGPEGLTANQLKDEKTFQLVKDHKSERIRQYRNMINGELVLASYEKPQQLKVKGKFRRWMISLLLVFLLIVPGMIIPRLSQWNQKLCDALQLPDSYSMSYIDSEDDDISLLDSAQAYWQELQQKCGNWIADHNPAAILDIFGHHDRDQYLFPDSDTRELTEADIAGMDKETIQLAINEIYARRGYAFSNDSDTARAAREYFMSRDWYQPTIETMVETEATFSDIEQKNVIFLASHRN